MMTATLVRFGRIQYEGGGFHYRLRTVMDRQVLLEIFYFDAGGGHRAAMNALRSALAEECPEWTIRPVDLQKLLEPVDPVHWVTRKVSRSLQKVLQPAWPRMAFEPLQSQEIYNKALRSGATYGFDAFLPMLKMYIRRTSRPMEALLQRHWRESDDARPALVISVIPNFNGVIYRALHQVHPGVPYVTIMTDMIDCPPRFWMECQDQILVCGTETAFEQARATGYYASENIRRVSGMILRREFYRAHETRLTHRDLGLSPDRPTAMIMFGGNGSRRALRIVEQLGKVRPDIQTIVMCGRNAALRTRLQGKAGCHAAGFTDNVAEYMMLADLLIGKPGPGSISEALHVGCPLIVECNATTMPQERPNVEWVVTHGVGIAVRSLRVSLASAVNEILSNNAAYRRNIKSHVPENKAVFEVADMLKMMIEGQRPLASVGP